MEEFLYGFFRETPFLISFLAGILTFLSPCILPLLPAYLSYISGISISQLKQGDTLALSSRFYVIQCAFLFTLGFGIIFILLGATMAQILNLGILKSAWVGYIAGGVLIVFGLHIARIITIPFLNYQKSFDVSSAQSKLGKIGEFLAPLLFGLSFALGWTPCIGPIFAAIISLGALHVEQSLLLMCVYALGLAIPFWLCAFLINYIFSFLKKIKRYFYYFELLSGLLLVIIGLLIATHGIDSITAYLQS